MGTIDNKKKFRSTINKVPKLRGSNDSFPFDQVHKQKPNFLECILFLRNLREIMYSN